MLSPRTRLGGVRQARGAAVVRIHEQRLGPRKSELSCPWSPNFRTGSESEELCHVTYLARSKSWVEAGSLLPVIASHSYPFVQALSMSGDGPSVDQHKQFADFTAREGGSTHCIQLGPIDPLPGNTFHMRVSCMRGDDSLRRECPKTNLSKGRSPSPTRIKSMILSTPHGNALTGCFGGRHAAQGVGTYCEPRTKFS
jgi:hypothetical protein